MVLGTTVLSNGNGRFSLADRPTDRPTEMMEGSKWTTFKGGSKYSGRTQRDFRNFGLSGKRLKSYGLYSSHDALQIPTMLGVVASVCR